MTYTTYLDTLPDPSNPIGEAGEPGGTNGPGYSSVRLSSEHKIMNTRTNSGRLISRELSGHKWNISIGYNPMTREEFEPVYTFLLQKRGSMTPFFVSLPQYKVPRNSDFATFVASNNFSPSVAAGESGGTTMMIENANFSSSNNGSARLGDIFTITDTDSNHKKTYQITRVETHNNYESNTTGPISSQLRIHFIPALQRPVTTNATINFNNPKFRVVLKNDIQEYSLNSENLYSFSLELEEAQP